MGEEVAEVQAKAGEAEAEVNRAVEVVVYKKEEEAWEGCRLGRRKMPRAEAGQVVIRILCRSVNPSDVACLCGIYPAWCPPSLPAIPGFEGMGVIHQIGEGVSNFKVGDRVFPFSRRPDLTGQGLWQDYIVVPSFALIPIPPSIPDEVAAQFLINPWTVVGMLDALNVPKGDYILQTAAASTLGRMIIQYAQYLGIKTINVVRRSDQVEELKTLGGNEVIVSTKEDVLEKVKLITGGKMVHSAIECIGGEITRMVVNCVRDGSTVLVIGFLGDLHAEVPILDLIFRDVKIHGFFLGTWILGLTPIQMMETSTLIMSLLERKIISPIVGAKFSLRQFKDAIKKSLESGHKGKVLLVS